MTRMFRAASYSLRRGAARATTPLLRIDAVRTVSSSLQATPFDHHASKCWLSSKVSQSKEHNDNKNESPVAAGMKWIISENINSAQTTSEVDPKENNDKTVSCVGETPRTSVLMELVDRVGVLHEVLRYFWKYDLNVTRIESRPISPNAAGQMRFDFFVDFDGSRGDANVEKLLASLGPLTEKLLVLDEKKVTELVFLRHFAFTEIFSTTKYTANQNHHFSSYFGRQFRCNGFLDTFRNWT